MPTATPLTRESSSSTTTHVRTYAKLVHARTTLNESGRALPGYSTVLYEVSQNALFRSSFSSSRSVLLPYVRVLEIWGRIRGRTCSGVWSSHVTIAVSARGGLGRLGTTGDGWGRWGSLETRTVYMV